MKKSILNLSILLFSSTIFNIFPKQEQEKEQEIADKRLKKIKQQIIQQRIQQFINEGSNLPEMNPEDLYYSLQLELLLQTKFYDPFYNKEHIDLNKQVELCVKNHNYAADKQPFKPGLPGTNCVIKTLKKIQEEELKEELIYLERFYTDVLTNEEHIYLNKQIELCVNNHNYPADKQPFTPGIVGTNCVIKTLKKIQKEELIYF